MPEQTPAPAPPQPNQILSQPATVEACRSDYQAGAAERASSERRDAAQRR